MATAPFESFGDVSDEVNKRYLNAETAANPRIFSENHYSERVEPGSHFISKLSMIIRVNIALNRTVVDSD